VLSKLPFAVDQIQTDNGQEFGSAFHWHLVDKGIGHIRIKPRTPRLNGIERSHRIDSEEFYRLLEGQVIDDARLFEHDSRSGGLLQLRSTSRRPRGPDALRTPTTESRRPTVIGVRQSHS
jgi:hypothetical protein